MSILDVVLNRANDDDPEDWETVDYDLDGDDYEDDDYEDWDAIDLDDEDDDTENGSSPPVPNIPVSSLGGKHIVAVDNIADFIIRSGKLLSTAGGRLFAYDAEFGCYRLLVKVNEKVSQALMNF